MENRVTLAILLPTRVGYNDYTLRVSEGGRSFPMRCGWPPEFCQMDILHRKWLRSEASESMELYHPKILGFESFFQNLRDRSTDGVESVANIPLPFPVESCIYCQYNLGWRETTTKFVYVDLQAFVEAYAVVNGNPTFEIS